MVKRDYINIMVMVTTQVLVLPNVSGAGGYQLLGIWLYLKVYPE